MIRSAASRSARAVSSSCSRGRATEAVYRALFQNSCRIHRHQVEPFGADSSPGATAGAPEAMIKTVGAALDGFGDLPDEDRGILFETFRVWQDNDASMRAAAQVLTCHPNTVRQRLRRIEKHTGRSLSRPRDVAELCLVLEVHRHLMSPKPLDAVDERRAATRRRQYPARSRPATPASMRC
jgi:PucR C-terminal helix-turn-helix domain